MRKEKLRGLLALCFTGILLGGCATSAPEYTGPESAAQAAEDQASDSDTAMSDAGAQPRIQNGKLVIPAQGGTGADQVLDGVFYFGFDQAIVIRTNHAELDKHARVLKEDQSIRLRLEGHADERGTREYNLALGERRAIAVGAYLIAQGATRSQFEVISYGEEKPVNAAHSESGWALNRRVEIVYR